MHKKRGKGKTIDKMPGPYLFDPESPDVHLGAVESLEHADHSLFSTDLSLLEAGRRNVSEVQGIVSQ